MQASSNGFLRSLVPIGSPTGPEFHFEPGPNRRIAPLWTTTTTDYYSDDTYVDTSRSGEVTIRWQATTMTTWNGGHAVRRWPHPPGRWRRNTYLTPTVGVSAGDNLNHTRWPATTARPPLPPSLRSVTARRQPALRRARRRLRRFQSCAARRKAGTILSLGQLLLPWAFPYNDTMYSSLYVTSSCLLGSGSSGSTAVENSLQELLR